MATPEARAVAVTAAMAATAGGCTATPGPAAKAAAKRLEGPKGNPIYQVGGKSFVFFRTPQPDATDPDSGQGSGVVD